MFANTHATIISPKESIDNLLLECSFIARSETEFTIKPPLGRTPIGILVEANRLSLEISNKPLIAEEQLARWRDDSIFTTPIRNSERIYIKTNVESVTKRDKVTEIELLAIIDALFQLDHGKDSLQGNLIRLQDFALIKCSNGLHSLSTNDIESTRYKYKEVRWAIETAPWQ